MNLVGEYPLGDGSWGREFDRNTCNNLMKRSVRPPVSRRTILSFAKGNSRYAFMGGLMGLDRDPQISDQKIPPCLPAPVPTEGGAGRYKIFSGIPVVFSRVYVCNRGMKHRGGVLLS
jgi:hypothetical protein